MELKLRKKYKAIIKSNHKAYLAALTEQQKATANLEGRFKNLRNKFSTQLRKESGSANSVKLISTISRNLFGLQEDFIRLSLPRYEFQAEKEIINEYLVSFLEQQRTTQYAGECQYYGETLLNIYLDLFITLTCSKNSKNIEHKPGFLINPKTGNNLELDVLLENFLLAFEFQGESHYREEKEKEKDQVKLSMCAENKLVLIPVNISQLSSTNLMKLICNSVKDAIGLDAEGKGLMLQRNKNNLNLHKKHLNAYMKACQRIYLASTLFQRSLEWADDYAKRFRDTQQSRNPISSSTEAPRLSLNDNDMSVQELYYNLKFIKASTKSSQRPQRSCAPT
ncbi:hypothetical protein IQ254_24435 [Nodosilinea sp. LEGE 07088]|uniref:hypothetical protein n=1 Tax=Nodosilinea sp. LEGE 07088 TaxID=2777968 RepID=UPI0018823AE2|nr:hypothetical protein [Nodosilinea sp. LEGE 07088]MBE9140307.1 hypothetical protein [Nodosilinea sp. LEGE 07088]